MSAGRIPSVMHHAIPNRADNLRHAMSKPGDGSSGILFTGLDELKLPSALHFKPRCDVIALAVPEKGPAADKGDAETE